MNSIYSMWVVGIPALQQTGGALPSRHPGAARRSRGLNTATLGSSPISTRLGTWSGWMGKTRKLQLRSIKSATGPNPRWMRKKKKRKKKKRKRSVDRPDPEKETGDFAPTTASHSRTPAAAKPTPAA